MLRENWVAREVSLGRTWENAGTNNTSSKVSALPRRRMGKLHAKTAAAAPKAAASAPRLSGKDKELEEKKKQAEAAEAAKKKAEEERLAKARADNCERAKRAKASMDSGMRIATTNAKGERDFMTDAARAAESKRLGEIMAAECGPAPKL
jgi:membrane protein involved in colicin uptake